MKLLRVKNWGEFQHYKHRSPPWIKLHRELLNDFAFQSLPDATRSHLMLIWILAAGTDGVVPHSAKFISTRIGATSGVDLEAIISAGFLIPEGEGEYPVAIHKGNGSKPANEDTGDVIERIPLNTGEEFEVRASYAEELKRLYPSVDIAQTLREARGWCLAKPERCKTSRGVRAFINGWMTREQNRG